MYEDICKISLRYFRKIFRRERSDPSPKWRLLLLKLDPTFYLVTRNNNVQYFGRSDGREKQQKVASCIKRPGWSAHLHIFRRGVTICADGGGSKGCLLIVLTVLNTFTTSSVKNYFSSYSADDRLLSTGNQYARVVCGLPKLWRELLFAADWHLNTLIFFSFHRQVLIKCSLLCSIRSHSLPLGLPSALEVVRFFGVLKRIV